MRKREAGSNLVLARVEACENVGNPINIMVYVRGKHTVAKDIGTVSHATRPSTYFRFGRANAGEEKTTNHGEQRVLWEEILLLF